MWRGRAGRLGRGASGVGGGVLSAEQQPAHFRGHLPHRGFTFKGDWSILFRGYPRGNDSSKERIYVSGAAPFRGATYPICARGAAYRAQGMHRWPVQGPPIPVGNPEHPITGLPIPWVHAWGIPSKPPIEPRGCTHGLFSTYPNGQPGASYHRAAYPMQACMPREQSRGRLLAHALLTS